MSTRLARKLDAVEIRVLGSLLEKEQTTPEACPLTMNALLAACNQKTNREPVTQLSEDQIDGALERLRQEVLVWRTESARSERWQQSVVRRWGLDRAGKALLTLLFLRGAQTAAELRSRSERLHPFASTEEVEAALARLAAEGCSRLGAGQGRVNEDVGVDALPRVARVHGNQDRAEQRHGV